MWPVDFETFRPRQEESNLPRGGEGSFCIVSDQSRDLELIGANKELGCIGRALEAALDKVAS